MEAGQPTVSVTVLNETDESVDCEAWASFVERVLMAEGVVGPAETNVVFVDREAMAALNTEHMGADGPTDVLSFPIDEEVPDAGARFVGDIVVCGEVAAENAPGHAGDPDDEIALLLVHGTLHLLGHDHAVPSERAEMWAAERRLLADLWRPLSRDPWAAVEEDAS